MRYLLVIALLLLRGGVAVGQSAETNGARFTEFENPNKMKMKLDAEIIDDKNFTLKIPPRLENSMTEVSGSFLHVLSFKNGSKIVLLYIPNEKDVEVSRSQNLSLREFKKVCARHNLVENLKSILLKPRARFGLNKLSELAFYALYLNVSRSDVPDFDYAIGSIQLK